MVEDPIFKEIVRNSFKKARDHMNSLETQIKAQKAEIQAIKTLLEQIKGQRIPNSTEFLQEEPSKLEIQKSSIGNEGVYSLTHSVTHSLTKHINNLNNLEKTLKRAFSRLTKQEFLVFLTIYQLEDEISEVTHSHLAQKLKLTEGCIRSYVSSIIRKGLPLTRQKINNKLTVLRISPEFRAMNLKQTLTNMFYDIDPNQTNLLDNTR
ncbi:MAG: hypothetical protein KKH88_00170 [Nanoarchaeota archaeon]|nr:hypothetical protein [Nanoarchaeota archaeon]